MISLFEHARTPVVVALMLGIPACGGAPEAPPKAEPVFDEVDKVALMEAHYTAAIQGHDALIRDDLGGFRAAMAELTTQHTPASAPPAWKALNQTLRDAAGKAAQSTTRAEAAGVMAQVVLTCGACHASGQGGPQYTQPPAPQGATPLESKMLEHQWATERLWEGITGPRDEAWGRGAEAIASTSVLAPDAAGDLVAKQAALRELGERAKAASDPAARSAVYASLLVGCADCHEAAKVEFAK